MLMLILYPSFGHPSGSFKKDHDQVMHAFEHICKFCANYALCNV